MTAITVFSRRGCHLCEALIEELEPMCHVAQVPLRVVDVDSDPYLQQLYGTRIPVVCDGAVEISGWPFDRQRVSHWLERARENR